MTRPRRFYMLPVPTTVTPEESAALGRMAKNKADAHDLAVVEAVRERLAVRRPRRRERAEPRRLSAARMQAAEPA